MPFPDQDAIHYDIAQAKFRCKLNMTEAYEQTRIRPEDVGKMTFSTIFGTFQSQVMQMGDCNAPSTFQWLMTATVGNKTVRMFGSFGLCIEYIF